MTNKEKEAAIQKWCHQSGDDCDDCPIDEICTRVAGDFLKNPDACDKAFEIIRRSERKHDLVNHPAHYESGKYECIDVMTEALGEETTKGFCLGNAFKYIYRCKRKHDAPLDDVQKALWYLKKFLELEGVQA